MTRFASVPAVLGNSRNRVLFGRGGGLGRRHSGFDLGYEAAQPAQSGAVENDLIAPRQAAETGSRHERQGRGDSLLEPDAAAAQADSIFLVVAVGDDQGAVILCLPAPEAVVLHASFFICRKCRSDKDSADQKAGDYYCHSLHGSLLATKRGLVPFSPNLP